MRYRKLDPNGDYTFGHGKLDFLIDDPDAVAQAIQTALLLYQGEWFLDTTAGMPWSSQVLGYNTQALYDTAIKAKILSVTGIKSILKYSSSLNRALRALSVTVTVDTIFGAVSTSSNVNIGGYGAGGYGGGGYGG